MFFYELHEGDDEVYSDAIGASLASQALFAYAPAPERARRVVSKLHQVPRLVQAARDNIKDCPGIFVKVGLETSGFLVTWRIRPPRRRRRLNRTLRISRRMSRLAPRRRFDWGGRDSNRS